MHRNINGAPTNSQLSGHPVRPANGRGRDGETYNCRRLSTSYIYNDRAGKDEIVFAPLSSSVGNGRCYFTEKNGEGGGGEGRGVLSGFSPPPRQYDVTITYSDFSTDASSGNDSQSDFSFPTSDTPLSLEGNTMVDIHSRHTSGMSSPTQWDLR